MLRVSWLSSGSSLPFEVLQGACSFGCRSQAPTNWKHFKFQRRADSRTRIATEKERGCRRGEAAASLGVEGGVKLRIDSVRRAAYTLRSALMAARLFAGASFLPFLSLVPVFAIGSPPDLPWPRVLLTGLEHWNAFCEPNSRGIRGLLPDGESSTYRSRPGPECRGAQLEGGIIPLKGVLISPIRVMSGMDRPAGSNPAGGKLVRRFAMSFEIIRRPNSVGSGGGANGSAKSKGHPSRVARMLTDERVSSLLRCDNRTQVRQVAQRLGRCELLSLLGGFLGHDNASERIQKAPVLSTPDRARGGPKWQADPRSGEAENKEVTCRGPKNSRRTYRLGEKAAPFEGNYSPGLWLRLLSAV